MEDILVVTDLEKRFGGVNAISSLSFSIKRGVIFSIIGPNGAGKTTLLNIISGVYKSNAGKIEFEGRDITNLTTFEISRFGISRTFQNLQIFRNMTVLENVLMGCYNLGSIGLFEALLSLPRVRREERRLREIAMEALHFCGIEGLANMEASKLPYGEQKKVEIARAIASSPKFLLLDEPAAGLNDRETADLIPLLDKIRRQGITIALVEHHMGLVMDVSDEILVLNFGRKLAQGKPYDIRRNPEVISAYLG